MAARAGTSCYPVTHTKDDSSMGHAVKGDLVIRYSARALASIFRENMDTKHVRMALEGSPLTRSYGVGDMVYHETMYEEEGRTIRLVYTFVDDAAGMDSVLVIPVRPVGEGS